MTLPVNAAETKDNLHLLAQRLLAVIQRTLYLIFGSLPRLIEVTYWPTLSMMIWGFINFYVANQKAGVIAVGGTLLCGTILWELLLRSQFGILIAFFEELWSRNLGHLFVSPLKPLEYVMGLMLLSPLRLLIAMIPCVILAKIFFNFWLLDLGWPLLGLAINLMISGWWCGLLLMSMLLRFGLSAEWLAWMLMFIISPFIGIYYPISVLPEFLHPLSWSLPPTYVFEMMRSAILNHSIDAALMFKAFGLNLLYLAVSATIYLRSFNTTRKRQGLLQLGE